MMLRIVYAIAAAVAAALVAGCNPAAVSTRDISSDLQVAYPLMDGAYKAVGETGGDALKITKSEPDRGYKLPIPDDKTKATKTIIVRFLALPGLPSDTYVLQMPDPDKKNYAYYFVSAAENTVVVLDPKFSALAGAPAAGGPPPAITAAVKVPGTDGAAVDVIDPARTVDVLKAVPALGWPGITMVLAKQ